MLQSLSKTIFVLSVLILSGCETVSNNNAPHPVRTLDRSQVESMRCVYLYRSSKTVTGWSTASATANALWELKDQAIVAEGNAVVITSAYPTNVWRDGYQLDAVDLSVDVYKCQELDSVNKETSNPIR